MAQCKWCDKKGWFLRVDSDGLCDPCQQFVVPEVMNRSHIIAESGKLVANSKNIATRLSRVRVALENLAELLRYERRGIPTLSSPPSTLVAEFERVRHGIVEEYMREQVYAARRKAEDASTPSAKLSGYAKAIELLDKVADELDDVTRVEAVILGLRGERDKLRYDLFQQKAEAALLKGSKKAALGAYVDAYVALLNDSTPDHRQADLIEEAKAKILELGGALPS